MPKGKKELKGIIFAWFETGQEVYQWAFVEDVEVGLGSLYILRPGDHLEILTEGGLRIFSNTLKPDYKIGHQKIPGTKIRQPVALDHLIDWTQKGFLPDEWAKFFFHEPPFRAVLRKK